MATAARITDTPADSAGVSVLHIEYDRIHPDPDQPRVHVDLDLWSSVQSSGLLQPILVRPARTREGSCSHCNRLWSEIAMGGDYLIVDGERRWRGAHEVLKFVPAIVREDMEDEATRLLTQLAANTGKPLAPLEEARAFQRILLVRPTLSQQELATRTTRKRSSVADRLALLKVPEWVPLLEAGEISVSQMVEISRYADRSDDEHIAAIAFVRNSAALRGLASVADIEVAHFGDVLIRAYPSTEGEQANAFTSPPQSEVAAEVWHGGDDDMDPDTFPDPDEVAEQDEEQDEGTGRPAHREAGLAAVQRGTAQAETGGSAAPRARPDRLEPDQGVELPASSPSHTAVPEAVAPPATSPARGLFQELAAILAERPVQILIGNAATVGKYRVTITPTRLSTLESRFQDSPALRPYSVEGTPEELDAELPAALAQFVVDRKEKIELDRAKSKSTPKKSPAKKSAAKRKSKPKVAAVSAEDDSTDDTED